MSWMSLSTCIVMYGWSMIEPEKGRCLKSPVSESQIARYTSVM
ncbi:MAG: hypothetical protein WC912_06925 [Thermovirgaceae bacterium]